MNTKELSNFYKKHRETGQNFFWRALQTLGKQGITFFIFLLCARLLEPFDFGVYNYVLAFVFFLIVFSDFGVSLSTSKFVAEYNTVDRDKIRKLVFNSSLLILAFSFLVFFFVLLFGEHFFEDNYQYVFYVLPLVFLIPLTSLYDGIYRGLKKFKQLSVITTLVGVFSLFFVYLAVLNYGLVGALLAQTFFYVFLLIALVCNERRIAFKYDSEMMKNVLSYAFLIGIANMGYYLYTRIDVLILGHFDFIEEIGYYEIINKIFIMVLLPIKILATTVAPNTTKNFVLNKYEYVRKKLIKESLGLFLIGLCTAVFFYFASPSLFQAFLPEYDVLLLMQMLSLILLLVPFRFFSTYINVGYITPSGLVKILSFTTVIFGILNVILNFLLIPEFGFIGVIYATLISQSFYIFTNVFYFYIKIKNG